MNMPRMQKAFDDFIKVFFPDVMCWTTWHPVGTDLASTYKVSVSVDKIEVKKRRRNRGIGTRFLKMLLILADQCGFDVVLSPSGQFGGDVVKLRRWYWRLGFRENTCSWAEFRYKANRRNK